MTLIPEWKQFPKMYTTWLAGIAAIAIGYIIANPSVLQEAADRVPVQYHALAVAVAAIVTGVLPVLLNLLQQSNLAPALGDQAGETPEGLGEQIAKYLAQYLPATAAAIETTVKAAAAAVEDVIEPAAPASASVVVAAAPVAPAEAPAVAVAVAAPAPAEVQPQASAPIASPDALAGLSPAQIAVLRQNGLA